MPPKPVNEESIVSAFMDEAAQRVPPKYAPYVRKAKPAVVAAADAADKAYPYVVQAFEMCVLVWEKLQPYNPQQFLPLLFGLAMCFFGGSYLTLIAAVEAVRLSVWDRVKHCFGTLYHNYCLARDASKKDDEEDLDGDGIADVKQISKKELLSRKLYIIARSVNPDETMDAATALWTGYLTVLATIRIAFAQAITLGCALGEMGYDVAGPKLQPIIADAMSVEFRKWAPRLTRQIFLSIGVMIAFFLQRIIGGFHSAVRGGRVATTAGVQLLKKRGMLAEDFNEQDQKVNLLAMALAAVGFYWQLSNGFGVPFPLNLLLLPATIVEWMLSFSLAIGL